MHRVSVGIAKTWLIAGLVMVGLLPGSAVSAGEAQNQLKVATDRVLATLGSPDYKSAPEKHRQALRAVVDSAFDWDEFAKRCLGQYWQERTPTEQKEFRHLLTDMLSRAYMARLDLYNGEQVAYLGEEATGEWAVVRTKVLGKDGDDTPVTYRMVRHDGQPWKVYDVDIDGTSMVGSYRAQFVQILRRSTFQELIGRLKEKAQGQ